MESKITRKPNPESTLSGLELSIINNRNHDQLDGILIQAQEFLAHNYPPDEVLSYESAKEELSKATNEAYTLMVAKNGGQVVGTVVFDVWPIPRAPIKEKLVSDGKNHYTPIFYATASEGYEPVLKELIEKSIQLATQYSSQKGKRNIGILTGDTKHVRVLRELAKQYVGGYLGKVGVPTLDDEAVSQDYEVNFKAKSHEKLIFIPFNERWTKSMAKKAVGSYLDEGYNDRKRGEEGYRPLTTAQYFQEFSEMTNQRNPGRFVKPMTITFTK